MSDERTIDALLREIQPLSEVLDDLHVRYVTIAPTGHWTFEKLGRIRSGDEPVDREQLAGLTAAIEGNGLVEAWSLRSFVGHAGATILLERRPSAIVDRIPDEVLQALKKRARRDGVTVIAGPPGCGKSNVLLWATRHLADEQIILVSETPPAESPGSNVIHVTTPASESGHRDLQRLMRRAPNVSWDRVSGLQDVNTFLGGASARRRVFTLDSSDTIATLRRFDAWRALGYEANLDVLLQLTSSVIGRAEVLDLLVFEEGEWREIYTSSGSRLEEVRELGRDGERRHAITRPGIEPDRPTGPGAPTPEDREPRVEALRAGIRKRPGHPTQDFEAPNTIPVPEASEASEASEPSTTAVGAEDSAEIPEGIGEGSSVTSKIDAEPSTEMLEELGSFQEEDPSQSGEIDLQGFIARKEQEDSAGMLPEETQQYKVEIDDPSIAVERHEASQPDEIIPGVDLNAEQTGTYNLENLKITRVEEVEEAEMEQLRALREESLADASSDMDDEESHFVSVEIDEEDLIYEDDDDWEEESSRTEVASSDAYEAVAKEITGRIEDPPEDASELLDPASDAGIEPDPDTSPSVESAALPPRSDIDDAQEDTAEFSIGDKIRIIRKRLKGEEG